MTRPQWRECRHLLWVQHGETIRTAALGFSLGLLIVGLEAAWLAR